VTVYKIGKWFFGTDEIRTVGPYDIFKGAADDIQLFWDTDATTGMWVAPQYRDAE
jgi:hypothetical protein